MCVLILQNDKTPKIKTLNLVNLLIVQFLIFPKYMGVIPPHIRYQRDISVCQYITQSAIPLLYIIIICSNRNINISSINDSGSNGSLFSQE